MNAFWIAGSRAEVFELAAKLMSSPDFYFGCCNAICRAQQEYGSPHVYDTSTPEHRLFEQMFLYDESNPYKDHPYYFGARRDGEKDQSHRVFALLLCAEIVRPLRGRKKC